MYVNWRCGTEQQIGQIEAKSLLWFLRQKAIPFLIVDSKTIAQTMAERFFRCGLEKVVFY